MISLNLISPQQKNFLSIKKLFKMLQNLLCVILIFSAVTATILSLINNSVMQISQQVKDKKNEAELKNNNLTQKINELNERIDFLNQVKNEFINWAIYLNDLSKLVPSNILLNNIYSNLDSKDVSAKGYAKTRDSLIEFKNNLENSAILTNIEIPLSNFLTQEEITFEISGKMLNNK